LDAADAAAVVPPPPPVGLGAAGRVAPFNDVFALEDTPPVAPALARTFVVEAAVDGDSADVEAAGVRAEAVWLPPDGSADKADAEAGGRDALGPEDGVSSALPGDGAAPAPAPEDEPAVFGAAEAEDAPAREDWM